MEPNEWIDPFDLLQQHQTLIERLVDAHNANDKLIQSVIQQQVEITKLIQSNSQKIQSLEDLIQRLE